MTTYESAAPPPAAAHAFQEGDDQAVTHSTVPMQRDEQSGASRPAVYDSDGAKLRLQGYYSAASFPSVPALPVGGLPQAPNGAIPERLQHANEERQQDLGRREEMLIQF